MKTFKFVGASELTKEDLLHIGQLLLEAEYCDRAKVTRAYNSYSAKSDGLLQIITPYLTHTKVLMDKESVVGFFIATTKCSIRKISRKISGWRKNDQELMSCLNFYKQEALDSDFILHDIIIEPKYRGLGLFKMLKNYLVELAKKNLCQRIVFLVNASNPAMNVYKHYGAKEIGAIDPRKMHASDRLIKCYFAI